MKGQNINLIYQFIKGNNMKEFVYRIYNDEKATIDLVIDMEKKELFYISLKDEEKYTIVTRRNGEKIWEFLEELVDLGYVKNFSYYELYYLLSKEEIDKMKGIINKDEVILRKGKKNE